MAVSKPLQNFSKNPSTSNESRNIYRFGSFVLNEAERCFQVGSKVLKLKPKDFDLLLVLVKSGSSLISKEQLMDKVWPDSFVSEANLSVHIAMLRKLFREHGGNDDYILTISKFGYRFAEQISISTEVETDSPQDMVPNVEQLTTNVVPLRTTSNPPQVHVNSSDAIFSLSNGLRIETRKTTVGTEITLTMDDDLEQSPGSDAWGQACDIRWDDLVLSTIRQGRRRSIRIAVSG